MRASSAFALRSASAPSPEDSSEPHLNVAYGMPDAPSSANADKVRIAAVNARKNGLAFHLIPPSLLQGSRVSRSTSGTVCSGFVVKYRPGQPQLANQRTHQPKERAPGAAIYFASS